MNHDELLTPEDLAAILRVSRRRVMEWQHEHGWPCVRIGRTLRWTPQQVEQIKALQTVKKKPVDGRTELSAKRSA